MDLGPLAALTALQRFECSDCKIIADLGPLAALTALQHLVLRRCFSVVNLATLAGLIGLQSLCIEYIFVADLGPLAGLTGLQSFDCSLCSDVVNLAPLSALTGLQNLKVDAAGCRICARWRFSLGCVACAAKGPGGGSSAAGGPYRTAAHKLHQYHGSGSDSVGVPHGVATPSLPWHTH